jgi:hypothetical protein
MYLITQYEKIQDIPNKELPMSRPGITYQEVANAAIQLQGKNEHPTVDRVREILKTGSKSTIARYLKEWKLKAGHVTGSDGISQELISIVKGLWERLKTEADQKIMQHQQESNHAIDEARQAFIQEQKHNIDLQTQLHQREEQLHQEKHLSATLHQSLEEENRCNAKLSERNDRLTQQLNDKKSEAERLHQLLSHVQNNLEHYQSSVQKLREEQVLNAEKQQSIYEREIHALKQDMANETRQKNQTLRELDQMENQLKLFSQQINQSNEENASLQKQLQEKMTNESSLQQQCKQLDQLNQQNQKTAEEQCKVGIDLEKKLAVASHQVLSLQKLHVEAKDTINILRDEKLFLSQEKSQLEGQLKQLDVLLKNHGKVVTS